MNQIRVLIIGMYDKLGGTETYIMNYYRNINRDNIQLDFISMYERLYFENEILELGGKIYKVTNCKKNPIRYIYELIKIINKNNYKIVHINMLSAANIIPLIAAKLSRAKCIIAHSHNSNTPKVLVKKILHNINKRLISVCSKKYWACSKLAGDWMFSKGDIEKKGVEIIKNAIDSEKYIYDEGKYKSLRDSMNIPDDYLVIGHVGAFREQKNHKFLLNVFNEVSKIEPKSILLLVGDGELKNDLVNQAKLLGIENNIRFIGVTADVNNYLAVMDIFVFPSVFEGLGIALIEAQAAGLPCIVSEVIVKEAYVTDLVRSISLEASYKEWAKYILKYKNFKRINTYESIINSGYDIKKEVKRLEDLYIKYYNN